MSNILSYRGSIRTSLFLLYFDYMYFSVDPCDMCVYMFVCIYIDIHMHTYIHIYDIYIILCIKTKTVKT